MKNNSMSWMFSRQAEDAFNVHGENFKVLKSSYANIEDVNLMSVLKYLVTRENISVNSLAKKIDIPTPTLNRLLIGEVKDPYASTLIKIADYFEITVGQLLGKEILNRKIDEGNTTQLSIIKPLSSIPILTITETANYEEFCKITTDWLFWKGQCGNNDRINYNNVFAVVIKNNLYEPVFVNGAFIIVNPNAVPASGDYVLVNFLNDSTPIIRKYVSEGQYQYLCPLNSEFNTTVYDKKSANIVGVIIEAVIRFSN